MLYIRAYTQHLLHFAQATLTGTNKETKVYDADPFILDVIKRDHFVIAMAQYKTTTNNIYTPLC
jgi:hypothetical protein